MISALALTLSVAIGLVLGMLGGGGAVLMLPMLVYVVGLEPKAAIATSLFAIGATSIVSSGIHARAKNVAWKVAPAFGAAAMAGAFTGGRLSHFVPGKILVIAFATMMLVTGLAMLRRRTSSAREESGTVHPVRALLLGVVVGLVSGLVGAGGGFLIVPALGMLGGLPMRKAIGTSLVVVAAQSFAGFAGHVTHVDLAWSVLLSISGAAVAGSLVGAWIGERVSPEGLRRAFAVLVLLVGCTVYAKELSPAIAMVAAVAIGATHFVERLRAKEKRCTTSHPSPRS